MFTPSIAVHSHFTRAAESAPDTCAAALRRYHSSWGSPHNSTGGDQPQRAMLPDLQLAYRKHPAPLGILYFNLDTLPISGAGEGQPHPAACPCARRWFIRNARMAWHDPTNAAAIPRGPLNCRDCNKRAKMKVVIGLATLSKVGFEETEAQLTLSGNPT